MKIRDCSLLSVCGPMSVAIFAGLMVAFTSCSGKQKEAINTKVVWAPGEQQLLRLVSSEDCIERIPKTPLWRLGKIRIASALPKSVTRTWRYAYRKHRWSIFAHAPTTLIFPSMQVGKYPVVRFGYYLLPSAAKRGSDGATFRVWCVHETNGDKRERIFEDTYLIGSASKSVGVRWKEVPIPAEYGETIHLEFETDPGPHKNRRADFCNWEMPTVRWQKKIMRDAPNVILFTLDTLRADHLSCYGYERKTSPIIDTLAAEGTLMTQAHAQCTATVPSHMSIMTSLHLNEFGIYEQAQKRLPSKFETLAESLNQAGYATAGFLAAGFMKDAWTGLGQGFDTFVECPVWTLDGEYVVNPALNWLTKHYGQPFFMWIHLYDCHAHYNSPEPFKEKFVDPEMDYPPDVDRSLIPKWGDDMVRPLNRAYYTARYDGGVAYTDYQVGRVVSTLKDLGVGNKTLIVIAADHGESLGEHKIYFNHLSLYEQNVRVPLIFHWPGKVAKGKRVSELCENIDIYPTILDLAGIKIPPGLSGRSLVPVWEGRALGRKGVVAEHAFHAAVSWRTKDWAYLYHPMAAEENRKHLKKRWREGPLGVWVKEAKKEELYDRQKDPGEFEDLSDSNEEVVESLRSDCKTWIKNCDSAWASGMFSTSRSVNKEQDEMLKGLGYAK